MNEDILKYIGTIRKILTKQEAEHGLLKHLSSRNTEKTSRAIDKIIDIMTMRFKNTPKNVFKMYDIKIFVEDNNFRTIHTIPLTVRCYYYLFLNTNFSSQYLLKKDLRFGFMTGRWPTLSPYLFLQIIWNSKCEDLLVESLLHIPLDLCVQILKVTIKHIHELDYCLQARRHIFLLIYKIYCKCLWLHLGTMSDQSVVKCISQLVIYFQKFLNMLANPKFRICRCHSRYDMGSRFAQHGILVKYTLRYIKKCMHSKTESVSENRNLAKLFTLTYGHYFNKRKNYHHKLPVSEVKSIVLKLEKKLAIFLLNLIKQIDCSEYMSWEDTYDDENTTISLQHAIVTECCHFIKFMKQNKFLVTNKYLSLCLEQLRRHIILPRKSTLTLSELCHDIDKGNLYSMKELTKRYKEWDLSILNFLMTRVKILKICDGFIILEYLHHKFAYLHTNAKKYQFYVSVLQILIQIPVKVMNFIVQSYVKRHFHDNPLECLYNEECLTRFMDTSCDQNHENDNKRVQFQLRILLTFILLNSRKVLSKFVMYEISGEFPNSPMFRPNMAILRNYYRLNRGRYSILIYILKDLVFQQRVVLDKRFVVFLDNAMNYKMIEAEDIIKELYITYLDNCSFDMNAISLILLHLHRILVKRRPYKLYLSLIKALLKTASLLRRYAPFLKRIVSNQLKRINVIMSYLRKYFPLKKSVIHAYIHHIEPLEITKLQPMTNTLSIIQEYEKRCFVVHHLRTNPRCHPKLRSYLQSFNLNQEAFIRHMILQYSYAYENDIHLFDLTFTFLHHFGWVNPITAYENMVRIIAEASQIALTYEKTFPKNMFSSLLNRIVQFSKIVESNMLDSQDVIRNVLLKTLSSMDIMICNTPYATMYSFLLNSVQNLDPSLPRTKYFNNIHRLIHAYLRDHIPETMPPRTRILLKKIR